MRRSICLPALVVLCAATAFAAATESGAQTPVRGKLILKGKTLTYSRAWLVRGPDTFDKKRPSAYLILSTHDLSSAIGACEDVSCVIWNAVKDGAVLQPADDGHQSFWLRVVSPELEKEQQLSARRWDATVDTHDRLAGKLQFSFSNTGDEADLDIDARLVKEFPIERVPSP